MLALPHKDPEQAWEIILAILARQPLPDLVTAVMAAGPLKERTTRDVTHPRPQLLHLTRRLRHW
jgi:hypothetical protein